MSPSPSAAAAIAPRPCAGPSEPAAWHPQPWSLPIGVSPLAPASAPVAAASHGSPDPDELPDELPDAPEDDAPEDDAPEDDPPDADPSKPASLIAVTPPSEPTSAHCPVAGSHMLGVGHPVTRQSGTQ